MTTRLGYMALAAWRRTWYALGQPVLTVIGPVSTWTLPTGYSYSAADDTLLDSSGAVVSTPSTYYASTTVNAVPARNKGRTLELVAGGVAEDGGTAYAILATDAAALRAAWGVLDAAGVLYRVREVEDVVPGATARVHLEKR